MRIFRNIISRLVLGMVFMFVINANAANVFIDAEVTSQGANPEVIKAGDDFTIDIYMQNLSGVVSII